MNAPSLLASWRGMLIMAGPQAAALHRSLRLFAGAAMAEALMLACFLPLLEAALATPPETTALAAWLVVLVLLALLEALLRWQAHGQFGYSPCFAEVSHHLRSELGQALRALPLETLAQERSGELTATLAGSVDEVTAPMGTITSLMLRTLIVPGVLALLLLWQDWRLGLALMVLLAVMLSVYRARRQASHASMQRLATGLHAGRADLLEFVQGLAVLRNARAAGRGRHRLHARLAHYEQLQRQEQTRWFWTNLLFVSLVELGLWAVMAWGTLMVLGLHSGLPVLLALLVIMMRFAEPLSMLTAMDATLGYMQAGSAHIRQMLSAPRLPVRPATTPLQGSAICFDQVTFQYRGRNTPALRQLSCQIPARRFTALVGASGCGKSTLVRLLLRYADPQQGAVRIGGRDLREMDPDTLMKQLSVVFQEVYLFDDSLRDNLRMARPDATDGEVEAAARQARCHDFIQRLPQGYDTRAGDAGQHLSGGEKQRLSLARAFLKDAPILILDEPTASLDSESQHEVQLAIEALARSRTVLMISHRLSTIALADQILVMDQGRLVEQGQHATLLAQGGHYARLWQLEQRHGL